MSATKIIRETAAARGFSIADIRGRSRVPKIAAARMEVAQRLSARGMTTGQIGIRLNRSAWTIRYYLNADLRARRIAQSTARWHLLHANRKRGWCQAFQPGEAAA